MTKNQRGLIVVSAILLIGGTVAYFLWKQKKDKDKPKEGGENKPKEELCRLIFLQTFGYDWETVKKMFFGNKSAEIETQDTEETAE